MGTLTFNRRRVRGGIIRMELDGRFIGEIATCKWGYALRLPGVYWSFSDGNPVGSGNPQKGFKRQKDAIAFAKALPNEVLRRAADTCTKHNLDIA